MINKESWHWNFNSNFINRSLKTALFFFFIRVRTMIMFAMFWEVHLLSRLWIEVLIFFFPLLRDRYIQCCCNNETNVKSTVKLHNTENCCSIFYYINVWLHRLVMSLSSFLLSWNYAITSKTSLQLQILQFFP